VLRADVAPSDIGVVLQMLCAVTDLHSAASEEPWRRYLSLLLAGLRPSDLPLEGTPLTDAELRSSAARRHGPATQASASRAEQPRTKH
jgi:hypothetical protein